MPNNFQGAASPEPAASSPLYTSRIFTGWYTNRSPLRDGTTTHVAEKMGYGRQDSILDGKNMEITPRLTLGRRAGTSAWGGNFPYQRINRFYSFNTFTLTTEVIRVMVDDATHVYDAYDGSQKNLIFTKSPGASSTYFLGVGNTLFFTNGVDNMQATFNPTTGTWSAVTKWGVDAPITAPTATQQPRPNPYPAPAVSTFYGTYVTSTYNPGFIFMKAVIKGSDGNLQVCDTSGYTGLGEPTWNPAPQDTVDGSVTWHNQGLCAWRATSPFIVGELCLAYVPNPAPGYDLIFTIIKAGTSGGTVPDWTTANVVGQQLQDGSAIWQNMGPAQAWSDVGPSTLVTTKQSQVLDPNGYLQTVYRQGKSAATPPTWQISPGALTIGGPILLWQNSGAYAVPSKAPIQYGYAWKQSATKDISNMSPPSLPISVILGNEVLVAGDSSTEGDIVVIYRTAQGGSTFLWLDEIPMPTGGAQWQYIDIKTDAELNVSLQAQVDGEGTPLPSGATCLAYHLGRVFAGVGNVVWVSSGPDAVASGSSGNAGFNISFTCQSKVTRLWPTSIGMIVFTVRDTYIILGNGVDVAIQGGTGLYIKVWIENLPLLHYDAFTTFGTTAFLFTGKNMVISLDPGAGIVEVSQPIADVLETLNPATAYLTYHSHTSRDTALYLGNAQDTWYRLSPSIAPESGFAWSLPAFPVQGMSALQSVEVTPGVYQLLMGPKVDGGRIFYRDTTTVTDGGTPYPAFSDFGVITLAAPGQLAGIAWMNLEAINTQNEPALAMLMGELFATPANPLEPVRRTRHDPPNLPESTTLDSTRYTFLRGGTPIWCRHLIFRVDFGTASTADELLSFTIFGSLYQEAA